MKMNNNNNNKNITRKKEQESNDDGNFSDAVAILSRISQNYMHLMDRLF